MSEGGHDPFAPPAGRQQVLLDRALTLIMGEWGYSRDRALAWLNDDAADWTPPKPLGESFTGAFMQVTRETKMDYSMANLALFGTTLEETNVAETAYLKALKEKA